jgi:hypothetical protein
MNNLLPTLDANARSTAICTLLGVAWVLGYYWITSRQPTRRWRTALAKQKSAALWMMAALQVGDLASTRLALMHGAFEMNPLVRDLGLVPAKLLVGALAAMLIWRVRKLDRVWLVCGAYCLLVVWNLWLWVL